MKQSRLMSLTESFINIAVGLGVAMIANAIILPALGFPISLAQNAMIAAFMTVVSIARSFALRRLFEAMHIRHPLSPGALAVIAERRRQIEQEGWTPEHDQKHAPGELARAGAAYAVNAWLRDARGQQARDLKNLPQQIWPWGKSWWKPDSGYRELVKAGALIIAELDRADAERKRGPRA